MSNTTPALQTANLLAKADPFVQRAEDDIDWARAKIVDQANEMRGRLARIVKEMQEPHAGPPATASMLSDAAQFERYLVEFEQKMNLLRTLRALRRAVAVPVEEAAAAG